MDKENTTLELSLPKQYDSNSNSSKHSSVNANESARTDHYYHYQSTKNDEIYKNLLQRAAQSSEYIERINLAIPKANNLGLPIEKQPQKFGITNGIANDGALSSCRLPLSPINQSYSATNNEIFKFPKQSDSLKSSTSNVSLHEVTRCYSNQVDEGGSEKHLNMNEFQKAKDGVNFQPLNGPIKSSLAKNKKYSIVSSDDENQGTVTAFAKRDYMSYQTEANVKGVSNKTVKLVQSPAKSINSRGLKASKGSKNKLAKNNNISVLDEKEEEEFTLEDKYMNLKRKAKDMRAIIHELVSKYSDTESLLEQKNQQLQEFQHNYKKAHFDILNHLQKLQEFSHKEEAWAKMEHELQSRIAELTISETEHNTRLEEIAFVIQSNEKKYFSQLESLEIQKQAFEKDVSARDKIIREQNFTIETLQGELESLRKELRSKELRFRELESSNTTGVQDKKKLKERIEELEEVNQTQSAKIVELNQANLHLEEKVKKYKIKFEEERSKIQQDNEKESFDKKEKIKLLKASLKHAENQIQKLQEDKNNLESKLEDRSNVNSKLEKDIQNLKIEIQAAQQNEQELKAANASLKQQNEDIFRSCQSEFEKSIELQAELKKVTKNFKKAEEKNLFNEKNSAKVEEIVGRLKEEIRLLLEENSQAKSYISQLESTLNLINSQQQEVSTEICNLRQERDYYLKSFEITQKVNKTLEEDLRTIDQKVQEFILQKDKNGLNPNQLCAKLKTLHDIQELIRNHRKLQKENNEDFKIIENQ